MFRIFVLAILSSLSATLAFAQTTSATTATVMGTVTDQQSGVLPGVPFSLSGSSMMGVQTQVTDSVGLYRFVSIPPGEYKLVFELGGFATLNREGVRLTAGFTATINTQMGVATLTENVQVTGDSPVVDTQSTTINTTFDKDTLANLPSARDYWAVLSEAPGVKLARIDVGGSAAGTQTDYFVYGTTGQNRPMVEGINSTESTGAFGNYVDYGSFSEISIGSGAASAESPVPGVYTVLVSKSGGNRYSGSFYGDYESEDWQSFNIDSAQVAAGVSGGGGLQPRDVNRLSSYRDLNADIGGFLKKDSVWWYASVRSLDSAARYTNFPVKPHETHLGNFTSKMTYQLSRNNKIIGYYQPSTKVQNTRLDRQLLGGTAAIHLTDDASFRQDYSPLLWKTEWNSVISQSTFLEIRTGQFGYSWPDTPNGTGVSYEDLNTSIVSGRARARQLNIQRTQVLGSLSYFKDRSGGKSQLQGRLGMVPRDEHAAAVRRIVQRRAARASQRRGVRSDALRAGEIRKRPLHAGPVCAGHMAAPQQIHRERGSPLRPLPQLPPRAGARGRSVHPGPDHLSGRRQREYLESRGAAHRRELRAHLRQPDGAQGKLRPVLVESRRGAQPGRQSESRDLEPTLRVERSQRRSRLAAR